MAVSGYVKDSVDLMLVQYGSSSLLRPLMVMNTPKKLQYPLNPNGEGNISQLTELTINDMQRTMLPNISTLANICPSIPVSSASIERSLPKIR